MSLAKRNNGCLECRTRRVICDKAEPECFKCRKKGIKCSGQGIECRFSPYMRKKATAAKVKASTAAITSSSEGEGSAERDIAAQPGASATNDATNIPTRTSSSKQYLWVDPEPIPGSSPRATPLAALVVPKMEEDPDSTALADAPVYRSSMSPSSSASSRTDETHDQDIKGKHIMSPTRKVKTEDRLVVRRPSVQRDPWSCGPDVTIQSISSDSRFFFDHFSNFIASKMVALDFHGNGYRQIILPIATQDPMVSQAVSVVSAFHLSQAVPSLRMKAEVNQQRVLSRLRQSALNPNPDQFFKLSNWVTILVLLVGDTITGSNNYVYLLDLLSRLSRAALSDKSLPDDVKEFVQQQTRMQVFAPPRSRIVNANIECRFEVFGTPLSHPEKALDILRRRSTDHLAFMSYCPYTPEQRAFADTITEVMKQACRIFECRASKTVTPEASIASVERMRQIVTGMDLERDGSHALVWPFFVAAAESTLPAHREFFASRLERLFSNTRFGSIPVALNTLRYIWSKSATTSWTDVVARERQVLIM
ncbi:Fungal transcriptional regulatory protein [Cordyceps fumosorosea ARSEF 2679]|uniref:Fungal transcriptional regulatory protein n=1 Tax=Cordyceps fumosorosea (strain ARSEF 2679) TaxID=1081104 RepID=A0A167KSG7_CORFA|nr:Fungal transcriptional regulatory protein [Cordyceps fumosorosea ARSEF 2679]OAA52129.1 Fungal transcriptional regulatory protein [Cordyceps fumosorosea ARSEF 2679]